MNNTTFYNNMSPPSWETRAPNHAKHGRPRPTCCFNLYCLCQGSRPALNYSMINIVLHEALTNPKSPEMSQINEVVVNELLTHFSIPVLK